MKIQQTQLMKQIKKIFKKEYIIWIFVLIWSLIFWEGHRIFPWAFSFRKQIPTWILILNFVILFVSTTTLVNKRQFSKAGVTLVLICVLLSWTLFSIGYKYLPLLSFIVGSVVIVTNLILRIFIKKKNNE